MSNFETWWEREGQEFLYALNTTTDDDIKLVAEVAWKNGSYCAEQAEQEPVAIIEKEAGFETEVYATGHADSLPDGVFKLYAAPAQQAEQEPFKMICPRCKVDRVTTQCPNRGGIGDCPMTATAQSAAPVRTKDLTDAEIAGIGTNCGTSMWSLMFARAVIAADREKNK